MADWITLTVIFIFGTFMGSFFYTLALRYSSGFMKQEPLRALIASSRCVGCDQRLSPRELLPVLGYLFQLGRCRKCGSSISPWYPVMEILYGLMALSVYLHFQLSWMGAALYLVIAASIAISVVDIRTLSIPPSLLIVVLLATLYPVIIESTLKDHLYGALLMGGFFLVVMLLFPGGFGGGDMKYAIIIGFLLGLELSIVALEVSLVSGSLTGVIYALIRRSNLRIKIPFAPFLTLGLVVSLFWGRHILLLYYGMF